MQKLDFEKPILELESKINELRHVSGDSAVNIVDEIKRMEAKADKLLQQTYSKLTTAQKVQISRHQARPHFTDYAKAMITDFTPLAGDRNFADDHALLGGLGRFNGRSCVIMGQEKGSDTEGRIFHNFGMTRPEGYRKAQRLMKMAEQFDLPIITLVDTAGAYPGKGAEERGQSEAIAKSIETCLRVKTPIVTVVIGEGGSGGAIAIAAADRIYMLEHSIYSVISPEGCASILFKRDAEKSSNPQEYLKQKTVEMSQALKLTAQDLLKLKLIDGIIKEPVGGAHRYQEDTIKNVQAQIEKALKETSKIPKDDIVDLRHKKFLAFGR